MPNTFSLIFCGTPDFAVPSLDALASAPAFKVLLVITQPDQPVGRKQVLTASPVKVCAQELKLPVFQPQNINEELVGHIEKNGLPKPDFLVVVAYGKILKDPILTLPTIAPINVHASLLPRWRGASPVEHAILAGDTETGVSVQVMASDLDAGDILSFRAIPITSRATTPMLKETLSRLGADLLTETLKQPLKPRPQPTEGITICRKLSREDGLVDTSTMIAEEIDRRVRALNPWPGVTTEINNRTLKLLETSLVPVPGSIPITCADNTMLHLVQVQPPGKKAMSGEAWMRGTTKKTEKT